MHAFWQATSFECSLTVTNPSKQKSAPGKLANNMAQCYLPCGNGKRMGAFSSNLIKNENFH